MAADASAYAVLGLDPDADWSAVEHAYKSLIKMHHPDRAGGDAGRAAEINRAYRELRQARLTAGDVETPWLDRDDPADEPRSHRWLAVAVGLAAGTALVLLVTQPVGSLIDGFRMRAVPFGTVVRPHLANQGAADPMTKPLDNPAIGQAVANAVRIARSGDEAAMAQSSRSCHARLHLQPSLTQLDACAAFDDAVVQLQNRDPLRDDGPFGQVAVTGRAMSGGGLFSDDYLAIDGRLDRIRRSVDQALAPVEGPPLRPLNLST